MTATELDRVVPVQPRPGALQAALVIGLVAIFAANAVGAVLEPASYRRLLEASPLSRFVGLDERGWATTVIAVNDGSIALALVVASITGRWMRWVLAVAGAWLGIAAVLKLTACV